MPLTGFQEQLLMQSGDEKINEINLPRLKKKYSYEWENIDDDYLSNAFIWLDTRLDLKRVKNLIFGKMISTWKKIYISQIISKFIIMI